MITQVSHSCHLLKAASPAPAFPALQQLASVVPQLSLFIALFSQALIMEGKRKLLLIVWWHGYKISCILAPVWTSHWSAGAILFACIVCAAAGIARTSVLWSWNLAPCTFTHHCELAIFFLFLNGLINTSYVLGFFFLHWVSSSLFKQNVAGSFSMLLQKCFCNAVFTVARRMCLLCAQVLLHKLAFSFSSLCWKVLYLLPNSRDL